MSWLRSTTKSLLLRAGVLDQDLPEYPFYVNTAELCLLCQYLEETAHLPGPILEIGVNAGHTTIFLNQHLDLCGIQKDYICLDTFSGFTSDDIDFEVRVRGKDGNSLSRKFTQTTQERFEQTMRHNGIERVKTIKADVKTFDFTGIRDVSFAFIDVDLYRPVMVALENIHPLMARDGIVAVHDCAPGGNYDGALQAYQEFTAARSLPTAFRHRIGLIRG